MPEVPQANHLTHNKSYIEAAFGVICNESLPQNHSMSWEILVSKRSIIDYNDDGILIAHIPVSAR